MILGVLEIRSFEKGLAGRDQPAFGARKILIFVPDLFSVPLFLQPPLGEGQNTILGIKFSLCFGARSSPTPSRQPLFRIL